VPLNTTVKATDPGTFSKTYTNAATWENNFMTLRIQLLGAIGGNKNEPIIKELDSVWANILLISGRWVVNTQKVRVINR
jgi:hypothetical protein